MWDEVTGDQGVPLPGDICSFTEVSQPLNSSMLLGSKSEYRVRSQAKGILPTWVVCCRLFCSSVGDGRDRGIRLRSRGSHSDEELCRLRGAPGAFTADIVAAVRIAIIHEVPLHIIRNHRGEKRSAAESFVVLLLPSAYLILAQPSWAPLHVMPDSNSSSYQGISNFSA